MTQPQKINTVLPLDWLIATGQEVTEEKMEQIQQAQKYANRERIPESHLHLADLYNELTKQEPGKNNIFDWVSTFDEWKDKQLTDEHIRAAWQEANKDGGGFFVGRPGALTTTAVAIKSKQLAAPKLQINAKAIESTKQAIRETEESQKSAGPRPAYLERPKNLLPKRIAK